MTGSFALAPPATTVDGLLAVPIDISSITAALRFDAATAGATGDATITYTVGPSSGNPIFDLRQTITEAWLDGVPFPPARLAHHAFGAEAHTDLRVVESVQPAGSVHVLRVRYPLALPDAQLGGAYLPALDWSPGPRLRFVFGLSDLNRARYLEMWLPANLLFDQYSIELEVRIEHTAVPHSVITNGTVDTVGANHWTIAFPARFSALSPLLEVRASDTLDRHTGTVVLPVSGTAVTVEAWKPAGAATDLSAHIATIGRLLAANERDYGGYLHGGRFVAFFNGGGMEYEGGTTTSGDALAHETFHSWFARGIKPAGQADGWWDEGFTSFRDDGADDAVPFDFTDPPVLLCSRDPWQRHTPRNAYTDGKRLFTGLAALLGTARLTALMSELYELEKGRTPVSTARIEEFLLCRTGDSRVIRAFHRFVYGLPDPEPAPDLWLRDAPTDPGADVWSGVFWDSPDLWVRHADDGGTTHQSPDFGQDNWLHARVRNRAGSGSAAHFVVAFRVAGFAGTQFVHPDDFLPPTAATAGFDLAPGETRTVRARWPRESVPPAGTHTCLLAAVLSPTDPAPTGQHVWEHNNLAQKNLAIIDIAPNTSAVVPVVIGNWLGDAHARFDLEILDRSPITGVEASLQAREPTGTRTIRVAPGAQTVIRMRVDVAADAELGRQTTLHLVQRRPGEQQIIGGMAVRVTVGHGLNW